MSKKQTKTNKVDFDYDAIIVGAGMSGMYQLYRLRELGLKTLVLEAGTGVGGTWYWNRYPGARFDSESWSYGYSFCPEVLEKWNWSEHFAGQPEIEEYCNLVADTLNLRSDIRFSSRVEAAHFDDASQSWRIELTDGTSFRGRYMVTALGLLSSPTTPRFEGIDDFEGTWCHTGLWPKGGIDFDGKRSRGCRDRCKRHSGHSGDRQNSQPSHRFPAPPQLVRAASQRADFGCRDGGYPIPLSDNISALPGNGRLLYPFG